MRFREDYLQQLRACLEAADDWHSVESCFRKGIDADNEEEVDDARPLVFAFGYMLVASRREQTRERAGVFGAQFEMGGQIFPAPLESIEDDMLSLWEAYAQGTEDFPLAASRLNDLLWVRRFGEQPVDRARAACDGYLALADEATGMELVDCLQRAIEIAAEVKDQSRLDTAIAKSLEVSRLEIADTSERRPGIPLSLLEAIVDLRPEQRPTGMADVLDTAGERYNDDPYIAESVNELKQKLTAPEDREELQREQVARWREEAKKGDAILRHSRLQQALGLARAYGLTETADEILLEMQAIRPEDFDLKPITAEVELPQEEVEAHIRSYAEDSES